MNFAKSFRDLAKTDKIDSKVLSEYGEKMNPRIQKEVEKWRFELEELTNRRDVLVKALKEEKTRLEKMPSQRIETSIANHLKFLEESIKDLEKQIIGRIFMTDFQHQSDLSIAPPAQFDAQGLC